MKSIIQLPFSTEELPFTTVFRYRKMNLKLHTYSVVSVFDCQGAYQAVMLLIFLPSNNNGEYGKYRFWKKEAKFFGQQYDL